MTTKLHLINHPVLQHKLSLLRSKETHSEKFRQIIKEMSILVAYEATRNLATRTFSLQTPMGLASAEEIVDSPILVSIMRAGNEMLEGILQMLPNSSAGHIGVYRDRFINSTVEYYFRLPKEFKQKPVLLLDPILATGDSILACIERLQQFEVGTITVLCLLVSQPGVDKIHRYYPDIDIYAVAIETELSDRGFLIPGIGDVGSRLYGT